MENEKTCGCGNNHEHNHNHECGCGHDHNHDHDHECGCGHDHESEEFDTIILTLDDDSELECIVIGTFDFEEKSYMALLPSNEADGDEVFLYEFEEINEEEIDLKVIEDDATFEKVSNEFEELFMEEE